ncbi:MAG TPA: glutamate--tRNA ligase family protein [Candidatus Limnocylindrales bacterium]|nr:glutamate--tRNA ligase family protein [Candidatus Limnocylindrales bacterium]
MAAGGLGTFERTRFAPAPTGLLHLGHVANAVWTWGVARAVGAEVLLRIEDHDRQRCRPEFDASLLEDLDWLGFVPDAGPVRQSDADAQRAYAQRCERLSVDGHVYGCDCSRSTFAAWARAHGGTWSGPGCPGRCRERGLDGPMLRVGLGDGSESWIDAAVGPCVGVVAADGDLPIRDRHGNWTYGFCVVVDDLRQEVDLVARGVDLLEATPTQIRLARVLGRATPPTFLHHPLVRRPDGSKLSKSAGDTGVRELRAAGVSAAEVIARASSATGFAAWAAATRADT